MNAFQLLVEYDATSSGSERKVKLCLSELNLYVNT